jgi:hypothetical protein
MKTLLDMKDNHRHPLVTAAAVLLFLFLGLFTPLAQSQQDPPLGDVARKERALKASQKTSDAKKVYRNTDVDSPDATHKDGTETSATAPNSESKDKPKEAAAKTPKNGTGATSTTVFDRAKNTDDDFVIVPAGTEIRITSANSVVDSGAGLTTVPVVVEGVSAIPALSKIHVQFASESCESSWINDGYYASTCANIFTLVNVEIRNVVYKTETDGFVYVGVGTMTARLTKPLRIGLRD